MAGSPHSWRSGFGRNAFSYQRTSVLVIKEFKKDIHRGCFWVWMCYSRQVIKNSVKISKFFFFFFSPSLES